MSCTTITTLGDAQGAAFGIDATIRSDIEYMQSIKLTAKADKQEIRGQCGSVKAVVFSKRAVDVEFTHYGKPLDDLGSGNTMQTVTGSWTSQISDFISGVTNIYIEEVTTEQSNTEACKTTVKAVGYAVGAA